MQRRHCRSQLQLRHRLVSGCPTAPRNRAQPMAHCWFPQSRQEGGARQCHRRQAPGNPTTVSRARKDVVFQNRCAHLSSENPWSSGNGTSAGGPETRHLEGTSDGPPLPWGKPGKVKAEVGLLLSQPFSRAI